MISRLVAYLSRLKHDKAVFLPPGLIDNLQVPYFINFSIHYLHNPIIHLHYPPKLLHNHCLQFLLGHENVPREVENNAYADFFFFGGGGGR